MVHSIVEAVYQHAQQQPEKIALFFEGHTITYQQLYEDATYFAYALKRQGIQPGDRIAIQLENCPAFVVSLLGSHLARGIVVLVNPLYRQVELNHIMADAGVRLCVTDTTGGEELARLAAQHHSLYHDLQLVLADAPDQSPTIAPLHHTTYADFIASGHRLNTQQAFPPLPMPDFDAPATIGYTSGTTGRSKGALLSHRNLISNIIAVTTAWHWTPQDHLLLTLPLFHTHGLMVGMHGTLFQGASTVLRRKFDAANVLATIKHDPDITLFFGVPTMYTRLLTEARKQGVPEHRPRLFVSGSAPLSPQLFEDFAQLFGQRILERYGMTETIMNLTNPYEGERRAGTVGGPFPGQEARIVDVKTRAILPPNEVGEIEVRGPHVFQGYWQRPDATAEAFDAGGWFKTGDLGSYSTDGYYMITGRARELIISGGYNIYPREVEEVLETHPAVAEVAVVGRPDPEMGEQVVAVIVPVPGQTPDPADLIDFCRVRLASYKKPRQIRFVEALPRNALGKVQKHLLA